MNINESIRDWVNLKSPEFTSLSAVDFVTMGENGDLSPPFVAIYETGSAPVEQAGVIMHGVSAYEITAELHTIPQDADQDGTPAATERLMRRDLFDIVGNRDCITYCNGRNSWRIFDIRAATPTTEPSEGRCVSKIILTVIACPI